MSNLTLKFRSLVWKENFDMMWLDKFVGHQMLMFIFFKFVFRLWHIVIVTPHSVLCHTYWRSQQHGRCQTHKKPESYWLWLWLMSLEKHELFSYWQPSGYFPLIRKTAIRPIKSPYILYNMTYIILYITSHIVLLSNPKLASFMFIKSYS